MLVADDRYREGGSHAGHPHERAGRRADADVLPESAPPRLDRGGGRDDDACPRQIPAQSVIDVRWGAVAAERDGPQRPPGDTRREHDSHPPGIRPGPAEQGHATGNTRTAGTITATSAGSNISSATGSPGWMIG